MLDAPHNSPAWPQTSGIYPLPKDLERSRKDAWVDVEKEEKVVKKGGKQILGTYELLVHRGYPEWSIIVRRCEADQ